MNDIIELEGIEFSIAGVYMDYTECFYCNKIYNAMTDEYIKQDKILDETKIKKNGLCKTCFMDIESQNDKKNKQITKTKIL